MEKMNNSYYNDIELHQLLNRTWEITDRPYWLYTAYIVSCLYEMLDDIEEDEDPFKESLWGQKIPKKVATIIIENATEDFCCAAANKGKIDVFGKTYTVRAKSLDADAMVKSFQFAEDGDLLVINKNIVKLDKQEFLPYEITKKTFRGNKIFLHQIVKLAEDDENDGWEKLTDMEVVVYCWAKYCTRHHSDNREPFFHQYRQYISMPQKEVVDCLISYNSNNSKIHGMYAFDRTKVMEWNKQNDQESIIDSIEEDEAENYWFDVALKGTFSSAT